MKLRTKAWLVSQGLLVITACIIQFTFHREIKVGPLLNTSTRDYWDIIKNVEPEVPQKLIDLQLPPEFYDARLPMTSDQVLARNLVAHRRAVRQEDGIRTALIGGVVVNILYFIGFHLLYFYLRRTWLKSRRMPMDTKKIDI
tara:strand:- start:572 stop:997 length:426 start_codon:yes stop_codon:yes gene_type:complete